MDKPVVQNSTSHTFLAYILIHFGRLLIVVWLLSLKWVPIAPWSALDIKHLHVDKLGSIYII